MDDFIWNREGNEPREVSYAKFILMYFRLPAAQHYSWAPFFEGKNLFCTYNNERYKVLMASRLGDIGITKEFSRDSGYDKRVFVDDLSEWSDKP